MYAPLRIMYCSYISDKLILFLSDGRPTDDEAEILNTISTENAKLGNQVVIHTFGVGLTDGKETGYTLKRQRSNSQRLF